MCCQEQRSLDLRARSIGLEKDLSTMIFWVGNPLYRASRAQPGANTCRGRLSEKVKWQWPFSRREKPASDGCQGGETCTRANFRGPSCRMYSDPGVSRVSRSVVLLPSTRTAPS